MDDTALRTAAFSELNQRIRIHGPTLPWSALIETFRIGVEEVYLANRARGIFKPRQMSRGVLSVKSTIPREGRGQRYIDDRIDDKFLYSLQGSDPASHDNQRLKEAYDDQTPFIYFHGISSATYEALAPAYVTRWMPDELKVEIQIGYPVNSSGIILREEERRYTTRLAKQRVHQAKFREMVLTAYGNRCGLSGLPVRSLLSAAHIFPDGHELGAAKVSNGIAMSVLHHIAYDSQLIGISPDGIIQISPRLMVASDGPILEQGLKALAGSPMFQPEEAESKPDRDALAYRYELFRRSF